MPKYRVPVVIQFDVEGDDFGDAANIAERAVRRAVFETSDREDQGRDVIDVSVDGGSREAVVDRIAAAATIQTYGHQIAP